MPRRPGQRVADRHRPLARRRPVMGRRTDRRHVGRGLPRAVDAQPGGVHLAAGGSTGRRRHAAAAVVRRRDRGARRLPVDAFTATRIGYHGVSTTMKRRSYGGPNGRCRRLWRARRSPPTSALRVATVVLGDANDADDVVQTASERAWRASTGRRRTRLPAVVPAHRRQHGTQPAPGALAAPAGRAACRRPRRSGVDPTTGPSPRANATWSSPRSTASTRGAPGDRPAPLRAAQRTGDG